MQETKRNLKFNIPSVPMLEIEESKEYLLESFCCINFAFAIALSLFFLLSIFFSSIRGIKRTTESSLSRFVFYFVVFAFTFCYNFSFTTGYVNGSII